MEGVQNVVDTLAEYEEINNKFGLPEYYEDPEKNGCTFLLVKQNCKILSIRRMHGT